jgi:dihydroxyacetone kinase
MLAASVSGDIFASPSAKQILQTIGLASSSGVTSSLTVEREGLRNVLVIINNYTGDRLNFGLAIEKALALSPIHIESVVVADDVSLLRPPSDSSSRSSLVGARGLAGNILVCKILSALAERGEPLARVKQLGDAVVSSLASVGVGLEHCHVPGRVPWGSEEAEEIRIGENECEIGLGLHNEPGVIRKKIDGPAAVIRDMLELIIYSKDHGDERFWAFSTNDAPGDEGVLFVNNLGGMSQLEMGAVLDEILVQLGKSYSVSASPIISCFDFREHENIPDSNLLVKLHDFSQCTGILHISAQHFIRSTGCSA